MVYCVGLTGALGSGKSAVISLFKDLDVYTINADTIARSITEPHTPSFAAIVAHFGPTFVDNGRLNRPLLRNKILTDKKARKWLEDLLHPLIRDKIQLQLTACTASYCVIEIPILKNKRLYPYLQRILLVEAPFSVQIDRIMLRENISYFEAQALIALNPAIAAHRKIADDIIYNDQNWSHLKQQVQKLHLFYLTQVNK